MLVFVGKYIPKGMGLSSDIEHFVHQLCGCTDAIIVGFFSGYECLGFLLCAAL